MKKPLAALFLVLTLHTWCAAAAHAQAATTDYTQLGLMRANYDHSAVLHLGDTRDAATAALGPPTAVTNQYAEVNDKNIVVWSYNTNVLYFIDDALVSYDIHDATLAVGQSYSTAFKVGDPMPSREIRVPDTSSGVKGAYTTKTVYSFRTFELTQHPGTSRNLGYASRGFAYLSSNADALDAFSEVLFNSNRKISNIYVSE